MLIYRADRTWQWWSSWPRHWWKCSNSSERIRDWRRKPCELDTDDNDIHRASRSASDEQVSNLPRSGVNGPSSSCLWQPWLRQVQQVRSIERRASLAESSTRMVQKWSLNPAVQMRHRWMVTPVRAHQRSVELNVTTMSAFSRERDQACLVVLIILFMALYRDRVQQHLVDAGLLDFLVPDAGMASSSPRQRRLSWTLAVTSSSTRRTLGALPLLTTWCSPPGCCPAAGGKHSTWRRCKG